ncbi:hypothetical protein [Caldimonas thermodepolymerans]|uniref:capsular polysaccharide export protein, LipB/KpsS family n=1 Tax=Caldimonas thermodepolymerans TaxID=215580 RepID=UPI00249187FE|nr:hypothetical protein [Caldimonas thermodepolymerans]
MNRKLRKLLRNPKRFFLDAKPLRPLWAKLGIRPRPPAKPKVATGLAPKVPPVTGIAGMERFELHGSNWNEHPEKPVAVLWGFAPWKRALVARYLPEYRVAFARGKAQVHHLRPALDAIKDLTFIVWGMTDVPEALRYAEQRGVPVYRMEDGFLRSADLGSRHTTPFSLALDKRGIYFDASRPSDLEELLNHYDFDANPQLMAAAGSLLKIMRSLKLSKYSLGAIRSVEDVLGPRLKPRVLVVGQVEGDASIRYGLGPGWTNLRLIQLAREENPHADIIYRPHPDVAQGFRQNSETLQELERLCHVLTEDVMLADLLTAVDRVYTMTSLSGFEALIHGVPVTVVGAPFYAGWGLTDDRAPVARRHRTLTVEQLFCVAYLVYPRYLGNLSDPVRGCLAAMVAITAQRRAMLDAAVTSEAILASPESFFGSDYWPAVLRPAHWSAIKRKYGKKLPGMLRLPQVLAEGGSHFHRAIAYLLAGQMREPDILAALLKELRNNVRVEDFIRLLEDLTAYAPLSLVLDHLAWAWERTGDASSARAALRHVALGEEIQLPFDTPQPIDPVKWSDGLKLAQFELRQRHLDEAASLFHRLLLAGMLTGEVIAGLAEIAKLRFDFRSSVTLLRFINRFSAGRKDGRTCLAEAKAAALIVDGPRIFEPLASACLQNPGTSESIFGLEQSLIGSFGELPYLDGFLAATETQETDTPIAQARAFISAELPHRAEEVLLKQKPRPSQVQQHCLTLSLAYSYQGKIENARKIISELIRQHPSASVYREALRICVLGNDYSWAQKLIDTAAERGIDVGDMYRRKVALGSGNIRAGYESFRDFRYSHTMRAYLQEKYVQTLTGQPTKRSVLIVAYFGPGDEIRFASRYRQMNEVARAKSIIFTVDPRLASLFQRSYPELHFEPVARIRSLNWLSDYTNYLDLPGSELHTAFDNHGWALVRNADQVILTIDALGDVIGGYETFDGMPYLIADPHAVSEWQNRLHLHQGKALVGLSWRSKLSTYSRNEHYLCVDDLLPLFEFTDTQFVNLQYDNCHEELAYLEQRFPGRIINFPDLDQFNDFEGVAALMSCLDLIIAPATTVVELAGALGRPTLLLSNSSELHWRKRPGTNVDVWHRSVTHVEGERLGDKRSLVEALITTLRQYRREATGANASTARHELVGGAVA